MKLADALIQALVDHGVQQAFGIPGDFALPLFKALDESKRLPLFMLSHEPGVGFAADAAARIASAPSAAFVTYGAGALNMLNAVASAYAEQVPVVVVSGAPGTHEGRGMLKLHHQVKTLDSQMIIYREVTCDQARLDDPRRAPEDIARVLSSCITQSRPVYFEFPRDLVDAPCEPVPVLPAPAVSLDAISDCVDEVLERIARAQSPVMMLGVEVRRFRLEAPVAELARKLGIPVVTSFMGHGLLPAQDSPLVGAYLGTAGDPAITHLVEDSDCLLLLGVTPCDTNLGVSEHTIAPRTTILAHNRSVGVGHHRYPDVPLAALVEGLVARLAREPRVPHALPDLQSQPSGAVRRRRCTAVTGRHRGGDQRCVRAPRALAAGRGHGRLHVRRIRHRPFRTRRSRLLRQHGVRGAGGTWLAGSDRAPPPGPGGRRRIPDDRLGAGQLPALRLGSDRRRLQQPQLGNAARVPAGFVAV